MFTGIDKKRPTRAPYEIHNLEGMMLTCRHYGGLKKDIPMLMRITKDTSVTLTKG